MALTRDKIKKEDKWNIESIYKDNQEFDEYYNKLDTMIDELSHKLTNFLDSKDSFTEFMLFDEKISILLEKLYVYASCKNDEDKSNSTYQALSGEMNNIYSKYSEVTSSVEPRLLRLSKDKLKEYFSSTKLKEYDYYYDRLINRKDHTLDEKQEELLSSLMIPLSNNSDTASYLMDADMKFGKIMDEEGKRVELTSSNYSNFIMSKNRNVRKTAFKKYHKTYGSFNNTLTSTYYQTVKTDSIIARLRGYASSLDMYMTPSKLPVRLYTNLINTVHDNLDVLYKYYDLKKEMLHLDSYHLYDGYASVIPSLDKTYTFDEAKDLVLDALNIMGEEYTNILKTAFTDNWIDKYPNVGKRGGAYSTGSYDTLPFVLMNFEGKYQDVSTMAHELGHSMHTYFSHKYNNYVKSSYPIFLAEIASTTNELLLSDYMFKHAKTIDEKLSILNDRLDNFKATFYRQTMFGEFEKIVHEYVEQGNVLTPDYLEKTYKDLNKLYFGKGVVVDDEIKYEWSRIPHFYTPFYVYKYATSISISYYVARNIINKTPGFREKYIEFLKSGGRDYPLNILKLIDIDLTDNKVFVSAIDSFRKDLDLFEKLYREKEVR